MTTRKTEQPAAGAMDRGKCLRCGRTRDLIPVMEVCVECRAAAADSETGRPQIEGGSTPAHGSEIRRQKMSAFEQWEAGDGRDVMLLRHTGRWNEAFWLAFKAGWEAANGESPNDELSEQAPRSRAPETK